jgi:hypothetical protein
MLPKKRPCVGCGRAFRPETDRNTRCRDCMERAKVYQHQLQKRRGAGPGDRFLTHDCRLCRKHRIHVRALVARWDARGAWVVVTCSQGHKELREHRHKPCWACTQNWNRRVLKTMRVH